jgi:hypothetical protein
VSLREEVWKAGGSLASRGEIVYLCEVVSCRLPTYRGTYYLQLEDVREIAVGSGGLLNMTTANA